VNNTPWMMTGLALALACAVAGCKKSEDSANAAPSATVSAPPAPDPTPSATASEAPKPTAPPVTNVGGDISGCCAALKGEAGKANAKDKGAYQSAASVCDGLAPKVKSGAVNASAAKLTVRAQLQHASSIPGACR